MKDGRNHVTPTAAAATAVGRIAQHTPPPSPGDAGGYRIDTEGINDDVVVAVIDQLDRTGNRPHSARELATILVNTLSVVERYVCEKETSLSGKHMYTDCLRSSANPAAMVSSRLTAYLKRPWSSFAPCPIEKELLETHPRRTYFYLSTYPHQPIPEASNPPAASRIISPSLSSAAGEEEAGEEEEGCDRESRSRIAPSPSPEIDLSAPDLDVEEDVGSPITPGGSFSVHKGSVLRDAATATVDVAHNRRAASPPLERDEREFEQTASSLQKRKHFSQPERARQDYEDDDGVNIDSAPAVQPVDDSDESATMRSSQAAVELFGPGTNMAFDLASPVLRPQSQKRYSVGGDEMEGVELERSAAEAVQGHDHAIEANWQWAESRQPELIGVEELDEMFGGY